MKLRTKFQDEDFDIGVVFDVDISTIPDGRIKVQARGMCGGLHTLLYDTKAEFDADWEDYEEPKGSALDLVILTLTDFIENEPDEDKVDLEDCKVMLEKLKAFERLQGKGLYFLGWDKNYGAQFTLDFSQDVKDDLDLLFGGEE